MLDRAVYIPLKKTGIITLTLLLLVLGYIGMRTNVQPDSSVLAYGLGNKVIVVDAGHGGIDPGAVRGEKREKDVTLPISKILAKHLSQAGAMVVMLRDSDRDLANSDFKGTVAQRKRQDLANRVKKANDANADLYISIHTNADLSPRWSGAQVFYNPGSEKSKRLAEIIQKELTTILGNTKREAKTGSYYILSNTKMPTVIVEVGFISNPGEAKLLYDPAYQSKVAYAIYSGIARSQNEDVPLVDTKIPPP
ncbi:MAG TPA: N-acetylmuramoyl-L-alanine amidase CwlD [Syntrophomonas sp.]|jgi:N-acetylmuramoyl-L-alanine amidase|nr:N-acetylmuramoyl-L-alanine amidase CwlD [Syntrophomonas sp.]